MGPSIIIAAAVVGTGELIVAPRLGATVGLSALWLIVLGCVVKVLMQEEIGRHTLLTGDTTLEAFNRLPGKLGPLSWAAWAWVPLLISGTVQMGGILASLVQTVGLMGIPGSTLLLAFLGSAGTATVLIMGRYGFIEKTSGILVAAFTLMTLVALALLFWTPYKVGAGELLAGLAFTMPKTGFADAVAVFGITGIGTAELLFYPYWCLEKGYAKDLETRTEADHSAIQRKIRGMRIDIGVALVIYTFSTIAFFILGAAILNKQNSIPKGLDMISALSEMYTKVFGHWVFILFIVGAFVVLFSTFFVSMATWGRLMADTFRLIRRQDRKTDITGTTKVCVAILAVAYVVLCVSNESVPQKLIVGGGAVQTLMLPIFGISVWLLRSQRKDPHAPGRWHAALYMLFLAIVTAGAGYAVYGLATR